MEGLIRQNWEEAEEVSVQIAEAGVYVWPRPLLFGPVVVLLILKEGEAEANEKGRALIALSSVICLCEDQSRTAKKVMNILHLYARLRNIMNIEISKLMIFTQGFKSADLLDFKPFDTNVIQVISGEDYLNDFVRFLSMGRFHEPYINSHKNFFESNPIARYLNFLHDYIKTDMYHSLFPDLGLFQRFH